jgi:hypothetical protein
MKRTGRRRAARKLALISIRAPRWAKQRRVNRVDCEEQSSRSRVSQRVIRVHSERIYVAYIEALLGSVHNSIQLLLLEEQTEVVSYPQ